jgi:DNA-binding NarL/FixJ family response regulator
MNKIIKDIEDIDNVKIIEKRITEQPQLHYEELTRQEKRVLELLAHGLSATEIAEELCLSRATVKTHLFSAYQKTGIYNPDDKNYNAKIVRLVLFYLKYFL